MTSLGEVDTVDRAATELLLKSTATGNGLFGAHDWRRRYAGILFAGDAVAALLGQASAVLTAESGRLNTLGVGLLVATLPAWLILLGLSRSYDRACIGLGSEEFRRVGMAGLYLMALVGLVGYGFHLAIPRSVAGVVVPVSVLLSLANRAIIRNLLHRARGRGLAQHSVVVVGTTASALGLVSRLQDDTRGAFRIASVCAADELDVPSILDVVRTSGADTVAVAPASGLSGNGLRQLGWALELTDVELMVSTDLVEVAGPRIHVRPVAGLPILHVERPELSGYGQVMKRAFDVCASGSALLLLAPLMALLAILVRRDSAGGAIYRQTRVGKNGGEFTVLKFRTMRQGADAELAMLADRNESDGPLFKLRDDPRITRLGGTLRRLSLDELPQLWNVLRGDMSLVGPRPPLPTEVAVYENHVHRRLLVKPGVTGLWQVSGRSDLTWEQSVRLDLSYVENWSFMADLAILFRTVGTVLRSSGAY